MDDTQKQKDKIDEEARIARQNLADDESQKIMDAAKEKIKEVQKYAQE